MTTQLEAAPPVAEPAPVRNRPVVHGRVSPGYECVRDAFVENFTERDELGGACSVYHHGEKVVDLWGGVRNSTTGDLWQGHTMVQVHSATNGLAAMTLGLVHSQGWLDYEERVSAYWPGFAGNGEDLVTVRQLLAHQAGLFAFGEPVDHAITRGCYESELLTRIDPEHRTLGQFFEEEIARPLGLDFYIRLPEWIPNYRLATLEKPGPMASLQVRCGGGVGTARAIAMRGGASAPLAGDTRHASACFWPPSTTITSPTAVASYAA